MVGLQNIEEKKHAVGTISNFFPETTIAIEDQIDHVGLHYVCILPCAQNWNYVLAGVSRQKR